MRWFLCILTCFLMSGKSVATIDVMVKTSECVVFASDSRISDPGQSLIATDTYEKIMPICNSIMVQMQGTAIIGGKTFKSLMNELRYKYKIGLKDNIYVDSFNVLLLNYCKYLKAKGTTFGLLLISVAGIDSTGSVRMFGIRPEKDTLVSERYANEYQFVFFGNTTVAAYLLKGHSSSEISVEKIQALTDTVLLSGAPSISDSLAKSVSSNIHARLDTMFAHTGPELDVSRFSTKDAIELAYILVKATTLIDRLAYGNFAGTKSGFPTTGGEILVAVMTQDGFMWIRHPEYYQE